jgi:GTP cyclohydrolase III
VLHDIGKPRSYTSKEKELPFHYHIVQTEEILSYILDKSPSNIVSKYGLKNILPRLAAKHHSTYNPSDRTVLEKIIGSADSIASAADRTYDVKAAFENDSIYVRSDDKIFPHEINFDEGDLRCTDSQHTEILGYNRKIIKSVVNKSNKKTILLFKDSIIEGGTVQYLGIQTQIPGSVGLLAIDIMQIKGYIDDVDELSMLRGGSSIIENILEEVCSIISDNICEDAILFKGGGNILAFIPSDSIIQEDINKEIKKIVKMSSRGGLEVAVVARTIQLNEFKEFYKILSTMQKEIDTQKNEVRTFEIIKPENVDGVCKSCFKRLAERKNDKKVCNICKRKNENGKSYRHKDDFLNLLKNYKVDIPYQLQDIGDSIAVIAVNGNMVGRIFMQTLTPAEYNYKSETFDKNFKESFYHTIKEFLADDETRKLIENKKDDKNYIGIDPIYIGGDDILLIINARCAVKFCEMLTNNIRNRFIFSKDLGGSVFENPTVTVSCGIAIADAKFPIYFLLEAARKMEAVAKSVFREKTETDKLNIVRIPTGSIAFTTISGAMPSEEYAHFVLPHDNNELELLKEIISKSLHGDNRSIISSLLTCGKTEQERLNLVKSIYSSGFRKESTTLESWLNNCEWMIKFLQNEKLLRSAKMIIPQIWHSKEEI